MHIVKGDLFLSDMIPGESRATLADGHDISFSRDGDGKESFTPRFHLYVAVWCIHSTSCLDVHVISGIMPYLKPGDVCVIYLILSW